MKRAVKLLLSILAISLAFSGALLAPASAKTVAPPKVSLGAGWLPATAEALKNRPQNSFCPIGVNCPTRIYLRNGSGEQGFVSISAGRDKSAKAALKRAKKAIALDAASVKSALPGKTLKYKKVKLKGAKGATIWRARVANSEMSLTIVIGVSGKKIVLASVLAKDPAAVNSVGKSMLLPKAVAKALKSKLLTRLNGAPSGVLAKTK